MKELMETNIENPADASSGAGQGLDATRELEMLRAEIERTRGIFDSARLVVGHELSRPLTTIHGFVELLESRFEELSGQKEKRYFAKIKSAVNEIEGLIESFVHMLRFDNPGETAEDFDEVSIHDLVGSVARRYDESGGKVDNRVSAEMPPVLLRGACLEIVMDNLISNAIKHGASSEPVVVEAEIRSERRGLGAGRLLFIRVIDRGPGIPEKDLAGVFDPFYRGRTDGERAGGLGLGLALVRNVLNLMMGSVKLESGPGKGTMATVCIPFPEEKPGPYDRIG